MLSYVDNGLTKKIGAACAQQPSIIVINQSYETIEGQVGSVLGGGAVVTEEERDSLLPREKQTRKGLLATFVGASLAIALFVAYTSVSPDGSVRHPPAESAAGATPMQASTNSFPSCDLASCMNSGCDWDGAPFLCLDGESSGGCAKEASTWTGGDGCFSLCDLSSCADTLQKASSGTDGAEDLPRRCQDCNDRQCSKLAEHWSQACGTVAPFVCLSGAATWGCADNELAWASAPSTTCGECCDVSGC